MVYRALFDREKRREEGHGSEKKGGNAKEGRVEERRERERVCVCVCARVRVCEKRGERRERRRQEGKTIDYRRTVARETEREGKERESGGKRDGREGRERNEKRERGRWREAEAKVSQMLASARRWNVFKTKEGLI